jgi:hypothetical protein
MMMLGREIGLPAELMFGSPGKTGQPEGTKPLSRGPTMWVGRLSNRLKNE